MKKKILLVGLLVVLVAAVSVGLTVAFLTSQDQVTNTFTVGDVKIALDEAAVNENGEAIPNADRVKENTYKLIPGHTYVKDPTVTVKAGSTESYVRMLVTVTESSAFDAVLPNANLIAIFGGYDGSKWTYVKNTENADNTRTYEFRYHTTVTASADKALEPLFTSITVPGNVNNDQLKTLEGAQIIVEAEAIQADSFDNADAAWAAFTR